MDSQPAQDVPCLSSDNIGDRLQLPCDPELNKTGIEDGDGFFIFHTKPGIVKSHTTLKSSSFHINLQELLAHRVLACLFLTDFSRPDWEAESFIYRFLSCRTSWIQDSNSLPAFKTELNSPFFIQLLPNLFIFLFLSCIFIFIFVF